MVDVAVVADDLSGAVEAAATFLLRTSRISVTLHARRPVSAGAAVHVLDTDSRTLPAATAAARVHTALAQLDDVALVVKKIDSLLRGNLAAELAAARSVRPDLVVAPALPAAGRTVRHGVVALDGVALAETEAWRAEAGPRPGSVAAVLAPLPTRTIDLEVVRGGTLAVELRAALTAGLVPVCDALTDQDLDLVVAAGRTLERPVLAGSAGVAAAVARSTGVDGSARSSWPEFERAGTATGAATLVVVGSAAVNIPRQLAALQAASDRFVVVSPANLLDGRGIDLVREQIGPTVGGLVVVAVDPAAVIDPRRAGAIAGGLATAVTEAAAAAVDLVLTGGETARAVLDRLRVTELRPLLQVHHGAVVCASPAGQLIATRPGSFGGHDSLLTIVRAVQAVRAPHVKEPA